MKKIFFYIVLILLSYFILEILSFTLNYILTHKSFSFLKETVATESIDNLNLQENTGHGFMNVHPYLGYVLNPHKKGKRGVSDFGFYGTGNYFQGHSDDEVKVAILGGSLAERLGLSSEQVIESELRKIGFFHNKRFIFFNLAIGGYKQPQQLLTLSYLLALGGSFDIVINLDGFNEISLPVTNNIPHQVFPFFPSYWQDLVSTQALDYESVKKRYEINNYINDQEKLTKAFFASPLRYSITANLFYNGLNHFFSVEISKRKLEIFNENNKGKRYAVSGPPRSYKSNDEMYKDLSFVWKNCSLQLSKICATNKMLYFHFLQPNQYVPGSKAYNPEESKVAISNSSPYKETVQEGYPYLRHAGKELLKEGVNFTDLTYIFAHNNDILYQDNCCHLNNKGSALLAQVIGETINKDIQK